jgi:hypothetical protein
VGVDFTAMNSTTLGAANSAPKVGPIVVSEIMYFPIALNVEDENLEFIELENVLTSAQPLFDPTVPTNTWGLRSAIRFDFPTNITMTAGERILVVGFDPGNSTLLQNFKTRYSVGNSTRIFGPWNGHLGNSAESVQLIKPGVAGSGGFAPEILTDRIDYNAITPWPIAQNPGIDSLQRLVSANYGNEPLNWKTAPPTAGLANTGGTSGDSDNDGLPDAWELSHFGTLARDGSGDFDGDGLSDLAEYLAGTDPTNAADSLRLDVSQFSAANVSVRFNVVAGHSYRVESTDDLGANIWTVVQDLGTVATSGSVEVSDSGAGATGARFYRLRVN